MPSELRMGRRKLEGAVMRPGTLPAWALARKGPWSGIQQGPRGNLLPIVKRRRPVPAFSLSRVPALSLPLWLGPFPGARAPPERFGGVRGGTAEAGSKGPAGGDLQSPPCRRGPGMKGARAKVTSAWLGLRLSLRLGTRGPTGAPSGEAEAREAFRASQPHGGRSPSLRCGSGSGCEGVEGTRGAESWGHGVPPAIGRPGLSPASRLTCPLFLVP